MKEKNSNIQLIVFIILAACGIVLCLITGVYGLKAGAGILSFVECVSGVMIFILLIMIMYYQIRVFKKKQKELNEAIEAAEKANRAKSDFLAKMSHDVRTPLNTILAMNELIVANTSSARIKGWVDDSNVSGQILLSLIDDMLDITRIEAGVIKLNDQPWSTRQMFDETARVWKMNADKNGLGFEYTLEEDVPEYLGGDESAVRKIADNLLSNSVKYTKKGTIRLYVSMEDTLKIMVSDTGVGIEKEYLSNIFKPFDRGVENIYKETGGSGLGLAIVKELVDALGGNIECQSTPGIGTTFIVSLPLREVQGCEEAEVIEDKAENNEAPSKQFVAPDARILVVDDNSYNRKVIGAFLEPTLIQIDDVESGFEAIEMIDIREYDLVLMDLRMPKMDGAETLEKIKEEYPHFNTPVIALTADIMNGIEQKMLSRGFTGFLAKPVSSSKLIETIAEFIPDKMIAIETGDEKERKLAKIERCQDLLLPYGINLKNGLEMNAGNLDEYMMRAELFEEYADEEMNRLDNTDYAEDFYLQVHSFKSIAKGIGAWLLAELAQTAEFRKDPGFAKEVTPLIHAEYLRVREGLKKFDEEMKTK